MSKHPGPILVTGATGHQGGAALRRLLRDGWDVRALTRDPHGLHGRGLSALGAEVIGGDLEDRASLDRALEGAWGVFSVQNLQVGTAREIAQGISLADAARAARVGHFVYASVGGADRRTGIPHVESKWRIEEHIRGCGLPATILRPAFFTDHLTLPGAFGVVFWGALAAALQRDRTIQVIAMEDIGAFAGLAFADPGRWIGKAVELAGDEVTWDEAADAHLRARGRRPRHLPLPGWILRKVDPDLGTLFRWASAEGYGADIPELRRLHPALRRVEEGLREATPGMVYGR